MSRRFNRRFFQGWSPRKFTTKYGIMLGSILTTGALFAEYDPGVAWLRDEIGRQRWLLPICVGWYAVMFIVDCCRLKMRYDLARLRHERRHGRR